MRKFWSSEEKDLLINKYPETPTEELLELFPNRTWDSLKLMAEKLKIKRYYNAQRISSAKILLEETNETYYWLGFLMADGHFSENRLSLRLAIKDINHLEKFAKFIGCNLNTYKETVSVSLMDTKYISKIREKFNIVNDKTYNPCNISNINDYNLLMSLIIGFIDGDGSIGLVHKRNDAALRVKCHSSWLENLQFMVNVIYSKSDEIVINSKITKAGYAQFIISNNTILRLLKEIAINLNIPILERKWDVIDINSISRYKKLDKIRLDNIEIIKSNPNMRNCDFVKLLGVSKGHVTKLIKICRGG